MFGTKVMVSPEYVPYDLLGVGDRLAPIAQNSQSFSGTPLLEFPWFLLQLQPWASQLFENCSDTHDPSDISTDKNQGGSSPVNEVPTRRHTSCWSAFPEIALSASQECDLMYGGFTTFCWNHWSSRSVPLWRPSDAQNFHSTATQRSLFTVWALTFSSSHQYGPIMPCLEMATHAVQFTGGNGLCKTSSGGALLQ